MGATVKSFTVVDQTRNAAVWQIELYAAVSRALGVKSDYPRCKQCGFFRGVQNCSNSFHDSFAWTAERPRWSVRQ